VVQVDPIKPKLKPPGSKRLNLNCDVLLSNFAFKFILCHYSMGGYSMYPGAAQVAAAAAAQAEAYTRPLSAQPEPFLTPNTPYTPPITT